MSFKRYDRCLEVILLPNFICVGPGRAGTSWLYEVLLEHPQVCMAKNIKETQFFNENYERGIEWYERFFEYCSGALSVGEISNLYINDSRVPSRIKKLIPDCKILICLRNPYDRIQSGYSFKLREGALKCSFEKALLTMPEFMQWGRYYWRIKPYYDLFGHKNIFLIFFDDIVDRPFDLCRGLFSFLGVDENFVPSVVNKKVNAAVVPKFPILASITKGAARLMRKMEMYQPLTWAKRQEWIKKLLFRAYDYKKENLMTPKAMAIIDPVVLPEIEKLEELIGRSLDAWKHG